MNTVLEYALIASLFVVFASLASLAALFYTKYFSEESRKLRRRLKEIKASRETGGASSSVLRSESAADELLSQLLGRFVDSAFVSRLLSSAAVSIKPTEFVGITAVLGITGFLLALFVIKSNNSLSWIFAVALPCLLAAVPTLVLQRKAAARRKKFDEQFPEALGMMARTLQAGGSLASALGLAASELPDPCGVEFKKTADEINFGIGFNQAVANMADRIQSQDLNFFITALTIQRDTGGNLAELLNGLAYTIRERQKLAQKVRIISAEGRLSGNVLIALPFAMAAALTAINPEYMNFLWSSETGQSMVYTCLVMMAIGALAIRRIVTLKI